MVLGLGIPLLSFLGSGFFILEENEVAVVVEYNLSELLQSNSDPWTHFIALKEGQLPNGTMKLVGTESKDSPLLSIQDKDLYWHLPSPFGKHLKIDIFQDFQVEIPLIIPDYLYERDDEGNIIEIIRDDLGEPVVIGYFFVTIEGIKFYSPETWTKQRYDPDFTLDVLKVVVTGLFKVTDVETYASFLKDSHANKIEWIEGLGFYGEMTNPPLIKDLLEDFYLDEALMTYILNLKLPLVMITFMDQYPDQSENFIVKKTLEYLIEYPETLINRISTNNGTIPNFEDFITSNEFIEESGVDIEELFGINIADRMEVNLYEEPL